jgi:hypothetical protein
MWRTGTALTASPSFFVEIQLDAFAKFGTAERLMDSVKRKFFYTLRKNPDIQ